MAEAKVGMKRDIETTVATLREDRARYSSDNFPFKPKYYDFLLQNYPALIQKLDDLTIVALGDEPCRDNLGNAKDGSVLGENEICVSVARIVEKQSRESYRSQISALIIHEVSHLLGADEEVAIAMQAIPGSGGVSLATLYAFTQRKDLSELLQSAEKHFAKIEMEQVRMSLDAIAYMFSNTPLIQDTNLKYLENDRLSQTGKKALLIAAGMAYKACQAVFKDSIDCNAADWVKSRTDVKEVRAIADSLESLKDWRKRLSELKALSLEFQKIAKSLEGERFSVIYKD